MDSQKNYVGIDIGKDSIQIAYTNEKGQWIECKVGNTVELITAWLNSLPHADEKHFMLEHTGCYSYRLTYVLNQKKLTFSMINPLQSAGFGKVNMNITKTDKADARLLVKYGQANNPKVTETKSVAERHRNQELKRLALLKKQLFNHRNQLEAFSFDPEPNEYLIEEIKNDIETFEIKIAELEKRLDMTMDEEKSSMVKHIQSIKGIGPKTARLIVLATNGFREFDDIKKLMKYLGLAVVQRESGKKRSKGVICKMGMPDFRKSLFMAAKAAIRCNQDCKELYARLRNKGKAHKVAIIAVCQKLIRQMYGVVKSGQPFDNNYHLRWSESK